MKDQDNEDYEIKLKEWGKPVFKAKGKKKQIKKELEGFFNFKI